MCILKLLTYLSFCNLNLSLHRLKKRIYISITYVLLLAFVNAIAPKEILHSFHHHTETKETYTPFAKLDSKHTHCAFLQWQLPGFDSVADLYLSFFSSNISHLYNHFYLSGAFCTLTIPFLRGPPQLVA
jgi:hypothetical protein